MNMNKLVGLAFTYVDSASSENEFITAGKIGRKMIENELNCPRWIASRILEMLGNKDSWFPHSSKLPHTMPTNAVELFADALNKMNIRYTIEDYGFGGTEFKKL